MMFPAAYSAPAKKASWHRAVICVANLLVFAFAAGALAQQRPPPGLLQALPDVLVQSDRAMLKQRVEIFVRGMTASRTGAADESLVRWNTPVCLLSIGFSDADRSRIAARLTQIASLAGAPVVREQCPANFVIVTASDPKSLLAAWYAKNDRLFGDAPSSQIRKFIDEPQARPIRVWRNIDRGRIASMRYGHYRPSDVHAESSPFTVNAVLGFSSIFLVIDVGRATGVSLDQMADYITVAGLSNVDLDANVGNAESILKLFADGKETRVGGLSTWDAAFLKALYESDQHSKTQRLEIIGRVSADVSR